MDHVKRYINLKDYCSLIFVNKEWNKIISTMKEPLMLSKLLKESGLFCESAFKYIIRADSLELMKVLIIALEYQTTHFPCRSIIYKPLQFHQYVKIVSNKRLNYLNLLGF